MILGITVSLCVGYLPVSLLSNLQPVIPMALLFVVLLVLPQDRLRTTRFAPRKRRKVANLPTSLVGAAAFVAACWVVAGLLSAGNLIYFGGGITVGVVMLSLVLLTGYGGQVSLCQMTLAGVGAFCMGKVLGGSSVFGLVAAVALPAAVGAVLALVVLRLRGIYLALATLAFAYAMDNMFFNRELGYGGILAVGRLGVHSQRAFLVEVAALFAACAVGVLAIKRGELGRRLSALNDSEVACVSIGMNITVTKVIAFTLAAGIAGLGGALYGGWQRSVGPNDFQMLFSLIVLLIVALGGLDTVGGAFAAAIFYGLQPLIQQHLSAIPNVTGLLVGLGAISLGRNQSGIAGQLADAADWLRRSRRGRGAGPPEAAVPPAGPEERELAVVGG
jgi:branched-chain amino acid transport system permease protein